VEMLRNEMNEQEDIRILLLEDYPLDAELVQSQLKKSHPKWNVDHVTDKEGFESYLKHNKPDVVLSDYSLPQYTGMEAFFTVRSLGIEVPFIIVTGQLTEETAIECIKEGIDDYIIKSSMLRLDIAIQKAIQRRHSEDARKKIARELYMSELRYKSIFDHAGVAILEMSTTEDLRSLLIHTGDQKQRRVSIRQAFRSLVPTAVNEETLKLFQAKDMGQLISDFHLLFPSHFYRHVLQCMDYFSQGITSAEFTFSTRSFQDSRLELQIKTVYDPSRPQFFTVSFSDLTRIKKSEERALKVVERLGDTVAERMLEMSNLNEKLRTQADEREKFSLIMRENYVQMTESIIAAKRIQQLLLPTHSSIANAFQDAFVYMRPKDIVSGDFYWFYSVGNVRWIACVDCTGHGVPGAFMSMISSKMLNQAIIEHQLEDPAEVLKSIDAYVIRELKQDLSDTLTSTGMDISLCKFDYNSNEVEFAGAFQSLYHISDGLLEQEKGDRFSLGGTFKMKSKTFTLKKRSFKPGDTFYMSSDGYVDQFGGPQKKKFMRKRFIKMLGEIHDQSMYDQEMAIKSALQDWKGSTEQIDDILVMGIRV
jgi:serine phosphatase RsbU (regulator of sigma subunit)/DNA-binding response OmpR family regulator